MTKKIENLVKKCSVIEPLDGRVLIHPLKLRTYESVDEVPDYEAAKVQGLNPQEDEMPRKRKVYTINKAYQEAVVLQVAKNETKLHIGDTIIYKISNLIEFDLIPDVSMLKNFEIVAINRGKNQWAELVVV